MKESFPATPHPEKKVSSEELTTQLRSIAAAIDERSPGTEEFRAAKAAFEEINPIIRQELDAHIEIMKTSDFSFDSGIDTSAYVTLLDRFEAFTEDDKDRVAALFMHGDMEHAIARSVIRKRAAYASKEQLGRQEGLAEHILKTFDFSEEEAGDLVRSWLSVEDDDTADWYMYENLRTIRSIESNRKGAAKYLLNNFGIRGFGRYGKQELVKQYDQRHDMGPYGVFFQAVMDWNGSFAQSDQSEAVWEKVEEQGLLMRVIESNGKIDLAKRLLSLRNRYDQKIQFMYMHVHGNTDAVGFGSGTSKNRMLLQEDLKGKGVQRIKDLFEDDAEVVLSSCLTGVKGGLAEEMAATYGVRVIAADKPTEGEPTSIAIQKNATGNNVTFDVVFKTVDEEGQKSDNMRKGTVVYGAKRGA